MSRTRAHVLFPEPESTRTQDEPENRTATNYDYQYPLPEDSKFTDGNLVADGHCYRSPLNIAETLETESFKLADETKNPDSDKVPVRCLTNFTIYSKNASNIAPFSEVLAVLYQNHSRWPTDYVASGLVSACLEEDQDEYEDEWGEFEPRASSGHKQWIHLSGLISFSAHYFWPKQRKFDRNIYLETEFAWYILQMPSPQYLAYFAPYFARHSLLHLVITTAYEAPDSTYQDLILSLEATSDPDGAKVDAELFLGRRLNGADLEQVRTDELFRTEMKVMLEETYQKREGWKFNHSCLLREFCGEEFCNSKCNYLTQRVRAETAAGPTKSIP